jgi:enoyl-CoA hydratase/carnithine racemase
MSEHYYRTLRKHPWQQLSPAFPFRVPSRGRAHPSGRAFDAARTALGLVTQVVPDQQLLTIARDIAQKLADKPAGALQACKRLMTWAVREPLEQAVTSENGELAAKVRSADAKQAFTAFFAKRRLAPVQP